MLSHLVRLFDAGATTTLRSVLNGTVADAGDISAAVASNMPSESVLWVDPDSEFGAPLRKKLPSSRSPSATQQLPLTCYQQSLTALLPPSTSQGNGVAALHRLQCVSPLQAQALLASGGAAGAASVASVSICTPLDTLCGTFVGKRHHLHQPQGTSGGGLFYKDFHEKAARSATVGASADLVGLCTGAAKAGSPIYVFTRGASEDGAFPVDALRKALAANGSVVHRTTARVVCGTLLPQAWAEESCHLLRYLHQCTAQMLPDVANSLIRRNGGNHASSSSRDVGDMSAQHADLELAYWHAAVERGTLLPPSSATTITISSPSQAFSLESAVTNDKSSALAEDFFSREQVHFEERLPPAASSFINAWALIWPSLCGTMSVVGWGGTNSHQLPFALQGVEPSHSSSLTSRLAFEQTTIQAVGTVLAFMSASANGVSSPLTSPSVAVAVRVAAGLLSLSASDSTNSDFVAGRRYASFGTLGAMLPTSYSPDSPQLSAQEATQSGLLAQLETIAASSPSQQVLAAVNTLTNLLTFQRGIECALVTKAKCAIRADAPRNCQVPATANPSPPFEYWLREEEIAFRQGSLFKAMRRLDEAVVSGRGFQERAKEVAEVGGNANQPDTDLQPPEFR